MKSRKLAAGLALLGVVTLPGIHRLYLGQSRWGLVYVLLAWKTPISRIASAAEAIWYLFLDEAEFAGLFNDPEAAPSQDAAVLAAEKTGPKLDPELVSKVAQAVREMERLRQEGLITEMEFEQKRRKLLDQID